MVMKETQRDAALCTLGAGRTHQMPGTDLETQVCVLTRLGKEEADRPQFESQSLHHLPT